jgi:hypothetical protein
MTTSLDRQALQACRDGVNVLKATIQSDFENTKYYNEVTLPEYNAKLAAWNARANERQRQIEQWTNNYNNLQRTYAQEVVRSGCGNNCWGGWVENDKEYCWSTANYNRWCSRSTDIVERDALANAGPRPSPFTEQQPQLPAKPALSTPPVSITCCPNIANISGSEITDSTIQQTNDCANNLDKQLQTYEQQQTQQQAQQAQEQQTSLESHKRKVLVIVLVLLMIFSMMSVMSGTIIAIS